MSKLANTYAPILSYSQPSTPLFWLIGVAFRKTPSDPLVLGTQGVVYEGTTTIKKIGKADFEKLPPLSYRQVVVGFWLF